MYITNKQTTNSRIIVNVRVSDYVKVLWQFLIYGSLFYNFHRYIFKYSHGAYPKEGYQQTPLVWQAGKFAFIILVLSLIYINSRFINKVPVALIWIYSFFSIVLIINVLSISLYGQVATDEIEYLIYAFALLPICFLSKNDLVILGNEIDSILNISQYIVILSNWIVIINYFQFGIVPFHAYEGILLRFGGLWDDPNTLAIISAFFLGYAIFRKQYILAALHIVNIVLAISFSGYFLMIATLLYCFQKSGSSKVTRILVLSLLVSVGAILVYSNLDLIMAIYEAKRESVEQHSTFSIDFSLIPLINPIQFHETWWISLFINYFPISIVVIVISIWVAIKAFFVETKSLQQLMFILFFVSNLFLPFLYMFPVNFISLLFLVLYFKGVNF